MFNEAQPTCGNDDFAFSVRTYCDTYAFDLLCYPLLLAVLFLPFLYGGHFAKGGVSCSVILLFSVSLDDKPYSKHAHQSTTARDLLHHVSPLLYYDGEVMEAAITALGMVNPAVFK